MRYEKAKAEIIRFDEMITMMTASTDTTMTAKSDFFAKYISCGWFGPTGSWPFTGFECHDFTQAGTYHIQVDGSPVTIIIAPTGEEFMYSCTNYYDCYQF